MHFTHNLSIIDTSLLRTPEGSLEGVSLVRVCELQFLNYFPAATASWRVTILLLQMGYYVTTSLLQLGYFVSMSSLLPYNKVTIFDNFHSPADANYN